MALRLNFSIALWRVFAFARSGGAELDGLLIRKKNARVTCRLTLRARGIWPGTLGAACITLVGSLRWFCDGFGQKRWQTICTAVWAAYRHWAKLQEDYLGPDWLGFTFYLLTFYLLYFKHWIRFLSFVSINGNMGRCEGLIRKLGGL